MVIIDDYIKNLYTITSNKYIGTYDISFISKLELHIPSVQRLEYKDKIKDIVSYQEEYFKKNKKFNFLGVINIHYCSFDKKLYILDGQHRYKAILELYHKKYENEPIHIEIIIVNNLEELKENYELLNKNTPLPEFEFGIPEQNTIHNEVLKYFIDKYGELFSTKTKVRRPNISRIRFEEALEFLQNKLKTIHAQTLINQIETVNEKMLNWNETNFPNISNLSNPQKTIEECKTWKFFLGMFLFNNQEYSYDWVKTIIKNETGEDIIKKIIKQNRKKTIPKKLKNQVWDEYIGKELGIANCLCCNESEISKSEFHAGHYISEVNGGKTNKENLRPICAGCNLSMGKKNMDEYMNQYYKIENN